MVTKCSIYGNACIGDVIRILDGMYHGNIVTIVDIREKKPLNVVIVRLCNGKTILLKDNYKVFEKIEPKGNCNAE